MGPPRQVRSVERTQEVTHSGATRLRRAGSGGAGVVLGDRLKLGGEPDVVAVGGGGRVEGESEAAHASTVLPETVRDKR